MRKVFKVILAAVVITAMLANVTACGSSSGKTGGAAEPAKTDTNGTDKTSAEKKNPVTIKYATYSVGTDIGAPILKKQLEEFPKTKEGAGIKVEIEEIPGVDSYAQKMKLLIASGDLPDVVQPTGANFMDLAIKAGKVADLTPYFEADKEFKSSYDPKSLEFNTRDGKIYSVPLNKEACFIYYNKELFQKANVEEPKTWKEFWAACDKLKVAGITPLAMDTADFGWLTSLMLSSLIGTDGEAGNKWMNTQLPKDYNTPEVIKAFAAVQKIFQEYTTKDAVGGKFDNGANHFFKSEVAMITNGPWMVGDFSNKEKAPEGFYDKVGVMLFPEGGMVSVSQFGYMVGSKEKEKADAAMSFIKYITSPESQLEYLQTVGNFPDSPKVSIPDSLKKDNPVLAKCLELSTQAKITYAENQAYWYPNTLDVLSNLLPQLAFSKITPEDFSKKLTEAAQKNKE